MINFAKTYSMADIGNKERKAEDFSLKIIQLEKFLREDRKERRMSDQIFRSGTSIGANIAEAKYAESELDMIHKLSISQKEANETIYWLRLLYRSGFINEQLYTSLYNDCMELIKILASIIISLKKKQK